MSKSDELISRKAAMEAIKSLSITLDAEAVQRCIEAISNMPSAQRWIPCSERLPEYDAPALLSTAWGKTEIGWWTRRGWMIVPASYREFKQDAVVAWMPLPKPYMGKDGDNHD